MNSEGDENLSRRDRRRRRIRAREHRAIKLVIGVIFVGFLALLSMELAGAVAGLTVFVLLAALYMTGYLIGFIRNRLP